MNLCLCGHQREEHTNRKGPCQKCKGPVPCPEFRPPTEVSGKQPIRS